MDSLLLTLWQAGKDWAAIFELAAWRAEQEGDAARAADFEEAARALDATAEQDARTMEYIESLREKGGG